MAPKSSKVCTNARVQAEPTTLTEAKFQQQVCSLWKHTKGKPKAPITHSVPQRDLWEDTDFTLSAEVEFAEAIAYIAAVKKGVESVSASAIGLPDNPHDGLLVYVASNDGVRPEVRKHLQTIAEALQNVASGVITKEGCKDQILTTVIQMNAARINARLKARKGNRAIVLEELQEIFNKISKTNTAHGFELNLLKRRLLDLCQVLRNHSATFKSDTSIQQLKVLVLACYQFWTAPGSESTRSMLVRAGVNVDQMQGNPCLMQIAKIAAYEHIARMMVVHATDKRFGQLFCHITIRYVANYDPIPTPIPVTVAGGSDYCRVHAEVQLVLELDMVKQTKWRRARTIGSSKAACYLCNLFLQNHGAYFVPRTHGLLTPFWAIPDSQLFTKVQRHTYRNVISAMSTEMTGLTNASYPHRMDPAMSWQALSVLGTFQYSQESSRRVTPIPTSVRTATSSVFSFGVPSILAQVTEIQPEIWQVTTKSILCSGAIDEANHVPPVIEDDPKVSIAMLTDRDELLTNQTRLVSRCDGSLSHASRNEPCIDFQLPSDSCPRRVDIRGALKTRASHARQSEIYLSMLSDDGDQDCNGPAALRAVGSHAVSDVATVHASKANNTITFHKNEIFFEFDDTTTLEVGVTPHTVSDDTLQNIIDISDLDYGKEITISYEADEIGGRTMFLGMKTNLRVQAWLKLRW